MDKYNEQKLDNRIMDTITSNDNGDGSWQSPSTGNEDKKKMDEWQV